MRHLDEKRTAAIRALRLVAFDFDGVFTDNAVWVDQDGRETVRCSRADGIGLDALRRLGIELAVVSTEPNPVVSRRCEKLKLRCIQDCADKVAALRELAGKDGIELERVAFVGNDVNDLPALELVGLPVIVADAHASLQGAGYLQTTLAGGHGAVREFCDLVVRIRVEAATHA